MSKKDKKAKHHPDRDLIEACMSYCELRAGLSAAFEIDPDGNNMFAEQRSDQIDKVAKGHLKAAAKAQAQTMLGLNAKARAALFLLQDDLCAMDLIEPPERAFLLSLAADTKRLADVERDRIFLEEHERETAFRDAALTVAKAVAA